MNKTIKFNTNSLFVCMCIYITSKLLWDKIPVVFELAFIAVVAWQAIIYLSKKLAANNNTNLIVMVFIMWAYLIANALVQVPIIITFRCLYEYVFYTLFIFFMAGIYKQINLGRCLETISCWGGIIAILSWLEYITKHHIIADIGDLQTILYGGAYSFRSIVFTRSFLSHGVVLGVFSLLCFYLWISKKNIKWFFLGTFDYMSILTTGSRGPLVAFGVGIAFMYWGYTFFVNRKKEKKNQFILFSVLFIFLLILLFTIDVGDIHSSVGYFIYRIQNIIDWSGDAGNLGRLLIWNECYNSLFKTNIFFGVGPSTTGSWGQAIYGVTESGVLKRLCETGLVGFLMIYGVVFYIIKLSAKLFKKLDVNKKMEMLLWLSIYISVFVNDITVQSTEEIMVSFWFWGSLGALLGIREKYKRELVRKVRSNQK